MKQNALVSAGTAGILAAAMAVTGPLGRSAEQTATGTRAGLYPRDRSDGAELRVGVPELRG